MPIPPALRRLVPATALLLAACAQGDQLAAKPSPGTPHDADSGDGGDSASPTDSAAPNDSASPGDSGNTGDSTAPVDPCGDPSVIPRFAAPAEPALSPASADDDQGSDNIYAPDVVRVSDTLCLMYYGGQSKEGHDQIFMATSTDCEHWVHWPHRDKPDPVVTRGSANHVNDPSVVRWGGTWFMYYTVAETGIDDRIHLATSPDGFNWTPQGLVLDVGAAGTWDSLKVGRPAAVLTSEGVRLYYDGQDGTTRSAGLATSADGRSFGKHASNPLVVGAGAVDVDRVADTWVLLHEGHSGTSALTSADGLSWCDQGQIFSLTGQSWDAYGQVTPFLYTRDGSSFDALLFGGASDVCWCRNRVGQALPDGIAPTADPDAGCEACVDESDCTQACRDGGYGVDGVCAVPGSTDPGACCACVSG
ncbi:MAG: hypothetical protein FJ090_13045 [Deltaproteobacteria bacterium]|nr:hypothetical protein [Deltaproteobacteria bacterium]